MVGCKVDDGCNTPVVMMVPIQRNLMKSTVDDERHPHYAAAAEEEEEVVVDEPQEDRYPQHDADRMLKMFQWEIYVDFQQKIDSKSVFYDWKRLTQLLVLLLKSLRQQSGHQVRNYRSDDEAFLVEQLLSFQLS